MKRELEDFRWSAYPTLSLSVPNALVVPNTTTKIQPKTAIEKMKMTNSITCTLPGTIKGLVTVRRDLSSSRN